MKISHSQGRLAFILQTRGARIPNLLPCCTADGSLLKLAFKTWNKHGSFNKTVHKYDRVDLVVSGFGESEAEPAQAKPSRLTAKVNEVKAGDWRPAKEVCDHTLRAQQWVDSCRPNALLTTPIVEKQV
jgi:hypothetical protein